MPLTGTDRLKWVAYEVSFAGQDDLALDRNGREPGPSDEISNRISLRGLIRPGSQPAVEQRHFANDQAAAVP